MYKLKGVSTMGTEHLDNKKEEIKYKRVTCNVCYGMGVKEIRNGDDTIDCPNKHCDGGLVKVRAD